MKVTEVRIKLTGETDDRLLAFCSVTLDDCFVVRDLKIIDGASGPFVAMPSRKLTAHCPRCHGKNHLRSNFCTQCGCDLRNEASFQPRDNSRLYADIAHPINAECRELIQSRVIEEFEKEQELSRLPGYRSRYDDDYDLLADPPGERSSTGEASTGGRSRRGPRPAAEESEPAKKAPGKRSPGKRAPDEATGNEARHRSDPPDSETLKGPHQTPRQSGSSSKSDDPDDQFGAGIL